MGKQAFVTETDFAIQQLMNTKISDRLYKKLDKFQTEYYQSIQKYDVVFVDEKAGTGKSTIAVMAGLDALRCGAVNQLVYLRFPDAMAGSLGYLPGELDDKEDIYMGAFYDAAAECGLQDEAVERLIDKGLINLTTNIGLRGVNLKHTFLIIDETQNGSVDQIRLVLTRLHDQGGKAVVIGHSGQMDNKLPKYGGLLNGMNPFQLYTYHMTKKPWAVQCQLPINYRGKISRWADAIDETIQEIQNNSIQTIDK